MAQILECLSPIWEIRVEFMAQNWPNPDLNLVSICGGGGKAVIENYFSLFLSLSVYFSLPFK